MSDIIKQRRDRAVEMYKILSQAVKEADIHPNNVVDIDLYQESHFASEADAANNSIGGSYYTHGQRTNDKSRILSHVTDLEKHELYDKWCFERIFGDLQRYIKWANFKEDVVDKWGDNDMIDAKASRISWSILPYRQRSWNMKYDPDMTEMYDLEINRRWDLEVKFTYNRDWMTKVYLHEHVDHIFEATNKVYLVTDIRDRPDLPYVHAYEVDCFTTVVPRDSERNWGGSTVVNESDYITKTTMLCGIDSSGLKVYAKNKAGLSRSLQSKAISSVVDNLDLDF